MIFQGITGTSKQSFHLENMDVIITGKSSEHHLEVLNVAVLPKEFKSFESSHFKPLMYDDGGLSKPVKYPYIANINAWIALFFSKPKIFKGGELESLGNGKVSDLNNAVLDKH